MRNSLRLLHVPHESGRQHRTQLKMDSQEGCHQDNKAEGVTTDELGLGNRD